MVKDTPSAERSPDETGARGTGERQQQARTRAQERAARRRAATVEQGVWMRRWPVISRGSGGAPTSRSGRGARCARTTPPTATPGTTSLRRRPVAGLPLERGRPGRLVRRRADPVLRHRRAQRRRRPPQGTPLRPDQRPGQPRRGRQGPLVLHRQHPTHPGPPWSTNTPGALPLRRPRHRQRRAHPADDEYELFDALEPDWRAGRYFDIEVAYAKDGPEGMVCRITATNRGPDPAPLSIAAQVWYRNLWSWETHADAPPSAWPSAGSPPSTLTSAGAGTTPPAPAPTAPRPGSAGCSATTRPTPTNSSAPPGTPTQGRHRRGHRRRPPPPRTP